MKKKYQAGKIAALCLLIIITISLFLVSCAPAEEVLSHDLSTLYGVPELYNVKWDMSVDKVKSLIKIKYEYVDGTDRDISAVIFSTEPYKVGEISCNEFGCVFEDGKNLNAVIFRFSKDKYDFEDVTNVFINIYGEPHHSTDGFIEWEGSDTQIDIYDDEVINNDDHEIDVRFRKHKGSIPLESTSPESTLSAGDENSLQSIDPLGYLNDPKLIGSDINDYTAGMTEGKDYTKKEYIIDIEALKDDSFIIYSFFPEFDYMGAEEGSTVLEIYTPYDSSIINIFQYTFTWDFNKTDALVNSIKEKYDFLQSLCGEYVDCSYLSLIKDGRGILGSTFDELCQDITDKEQGIYNIKWRYNDTFITLSVTIDDREKSVEGSVLFS